MAQHHGRPMGAYPSANGIQSARVGSVSREEKKGEKPGGDLNALIFTLGRAVLLESRLSREGKGILGCEYCVLVASNANIDKGSLEPTKTAIRPTTDGKIFFAMLQIAS